jgi:hypothetical protein
MRISVRMIMWAAVLSGISSCATQKSKSSTTGAKIMPPGGTTTTNAQTTGSTTASPRTGPRSFASFFDRSKLRSQKGLIVVHWQDDKYYFEIPNALMGKDLLTVTRYVRTSPGAQVYGGEQVNENVLRFERGPENKVFIRTVLNVVSSPDSTKPIFQAVRNSNVDPIAAAFDIKAFNGDTTGVVIDVTDFFKGDNQIVSLSPNAKRQFSLSSIASDRSYIVPFRITRR